MPVQRRRFLAGLALLLAAGAALGWLYGAPLAGLLAAALLALGYQVRQLLRFERALRDGGLEQLALGDGLWSELQGHIVRLRQRVRKHKRRHRSLLKEVRNSTNAMPDGGVVLNSDFEIVFSNQAAAELIGISMPQDRGQRINNILRDPAFGEYLESENKERAVEIPSPRQEDHWLTCRLVPFGTDQYLLLVRDITERIRVNKMRRDFVANASHELRSPLTVISGYLDTLANDTSAPEDWRGPLLQMRTQAERMSRVVSELLELSRLENPQSKRSEESIDVGAMLALARRSYAGQPGVPTIVTEAPFAAQLRGVPSEIETIVSNLLANAVRHTPEDGRITLSWKSDPAGGGRLSVADTGEGIAEEHIPRLTERFFRVDRGRSRDSGGVGLGLAIVKHALLRHDASLTVESEPGKGSTFSCHFPAARIEGPEPIPISAGRAAR